MGRRCICIFDWLSVADVNVVTVEKNQKGVTMVCICEIIDDILPW